MSLFEVCKVLDSEKLLQAVSAFCIEVKRSGKAPVFVMKFAGFLSAELPKNIPSLQALIDDLTKKNRRLELRHSELRSMDSINERIKIF